MRKTEGSGHRYGWGNTVPGIHAYTGGLNATCIGEEAASDFGKEGMRAPALSVSSMKGAELGDDVSQEHFRLYLPTAGTEDRTSTDEPH